MIALVKTKLTVKEIFSQSSRGYITQDPLVQFHVPSVSIT